MSSKPCMKQLGSTFITSSLTSKWLATNFAYLRSSEGCLELSKELSKRATGKTLYILDEPTTGLHSHDIKKLLEILQAFVSTGNTVVVIEHNLDVIKTADHIIDMGPEGGVNGGKIIAEGNPEKIAEISGSYTGRFIRELLGNSSMKKTA